MIAAACNRAIKHCGRVMSDCDRNDKQISAQGSSLDFRPGKEENEEKPPSDDVEGQVNESFGKLIIFVANFL